MRRINCAVIDYFLLFFLDADLEELGPEFAGDEQMARLGVVGDSVEHGFGIGNLDVFQKARKVDPAEDPSAAGRDAGDAILVPDVGVDLAFNVFEFVEILDRLIASVQNI